MKLKLLAAFTVISSLLPITAPLLRADEKAPEATEESSEDEPPAEPGEPEEPSEPDEPEGSGESEQPKLSPEQLQERFKKEAEQEKLEVGKMMKVFTSLEGAWTGSESLRYEENRLPEKNWKDEWEGKYTMGGRYFEMTGQTSGEDMNSAYKWICTWDASQKRYRAWYFGDNSQNEYSGKLSQDGKFVTWAVKSELNGSQSRFTMKAEGNRVKCHGTDVLSDGTLFSTQTSEYTRKRVEL